MDGDVSPTRGQERGVDPGAARRRGLGQRSGQAGS